MIRIGVIIVIIAIIISMMAAMYMYTQYQIKFTVVKEGESVIVGPVEYTVVFDGIHKGNSETIPENTFVKIKIIAKNISDTETMLTSGQFFLIDAKDLKHKAIYGVFSKDDLSNVWLEPNKTLMTTTQFDIAYDEFENYNIVIRPSKQQSTVDTALICITNC